IRVNGTALGFPLPYVYFFSFLCHSPSRVAATGSGLAGQPYHTRSLLATGRTLPIGWNGPRHDVLENEPRQLAHSPIGNLPVRNPGINRAALHAEHVGDLFRAQESRKIGRNDQVAQPVERCCKLIEVKFQPRLHLDKPTQQIAIFNSQSVAFSLLDFVHASPPRSAFIVSSARCRCSSRYAASFSSSSTSRV